MTTELARREEQALDVSTGELVQESASLPSINRYEGIARKRFNDKEAAKLLEPVAPDDVEIRPDGPIYLPEIKYRRRLNQAFGPGAWGLMPTDLPTVKDSVIMRPYTLYVHGRFVSEAIGEQEYFENNPTMTWATAAEGAKSNALMRCCKDLGIASELWDPGFIEKWKKEFAVQVWVEGKNKPQWRRKDRDPLYKEKGTTTKPPRTTQPAPKVDNFPPSREEKTAAPQPTEPQPEETPVDGDWADWEKLEKEYKAPPAENETPAPPAGYITVPQQKRFWAIAKGAGWSDAGIKAFFEQANIEGTKFIKKSEYESLIERFRQGPGGA